MRCSTLHALRSAALFGKSPSIQYKLTSQFVRRLQVGITLNRFYTTVRTETTLSEKEKSFIASIIQKHRSTTKSAVRTSDHHKMVRYLTQSEAKSVDEHLMGDQYAFSIDQLMELAGLSVACAVAEQYPLKGLSDKRVLILCGPGNNGGDGLVAARHLKLFGYSVDVYYPKRKDVKLYKNLTTQCENMELEVYSDLPQLDSDKYGLLIDAMFGFSFHGEPRDPFKTAIARMNDSGIDICSVDIPSGWDVEQGSPENGLQPAMLVSLTAPKLCAREYTGHHYLGGRFVPPELEKLLELDLPAYENSNMFVKL